MPVEDCGDTANSITALVCPKVAAVLLHRLLGWHCPPGTSQAAPGGALYFQRYSATSALSVGRCVGSIAIEAYILQIRWSCMVLVIDHRVPVRNARKRYAVIYRLYCSSKHNTLLGGNERSLYHLPFQQKLPDLANNRPGYDLPLPSPTPQRQTTRKQISNPANIQGCLSYHSVFSNSHNQRNSKPLPLLPRRPWPKTHQARLCLVAAFVFEQASTQASRQALLGECLQHHLIFSTSSKQVQPRLPF